MKISLNYSWRYVPNYEQSFLNAFPSSALKVDIPHPNYEIPFNYFDEDSYQFISSYEKVFDVNETLLNKTVFLTFHGVMVKAKVYLNKAYLGEYVSLYLPFSIDVSGIVKEKNNRLVVIVDAKEDQNIPPFGGAMDFLTFGGIYREVELEIRPLVYLENVFVNSFINGEIKIKPVVKGDLSFPFEIAHKLLYKGEVIKEFAINEIQIDNPHLWDIDTPHLYDLITTLKTISGLDQVITTFGIRKAEFKSDGFYLNNKKLKLVGLNRHQSYPYVNYAMPKGGQVDDANILKYQLGLNVVRTSHYPQSVHFLSRCDEIGLLVINEVPGWQHISTNPLWRDYHHEFIERMIKRDFNHPSLIAHGIRINESNDDHDLYLKGQEIAKSLDPYRQTLGVRNFKDSELLEDVYSYNDFSCDNLNHGLDHPKTIKVKNKPILVSEYLGHMFPTKAYDSQPRRLEHALRHARVVNDNYMYETLCGAIGWCFVDYQTHRDFGSGDHLCYHGVMDIYRNPKYASYIYASQSEHQDVLELLSNFMPGDYDEAILGKTYVATNADYLELYRNDTFIKTFYPNREDFPYLKHPPIIIDDYIGASFNEAKFKEKDASKIKEALNYVSLNGLNKLPFKHKFRIGLLMLKHKMKYDDLVNLWNKYVSIWGSKLTVFNIKAYKNNKLVKSKMYGPSTEANLIVQANKVKLFNHETYDVSRVYLKLVDEYENICTYKSEVLEVKVDGLIDVLGPKTLPFHAGQLSLYVRSLKGVGHGTLTLKAGEHLSIIKFEVY